MLNYQRVNINQKYDLEPSVMKAGWESHEKSLSFTIFGIEKLGKSYYLWHRKIRKILVNFPRSCSILGFINLKPRPWAGGTVSSFFL